MNKIIVHMEQIDNIDEIIEHFHKLKNLYFEQKKTLQQFEKELVLINKNPENEPSLEVNLFKSNQ